MKQIKCIRSLLLASVVFPLLPGSTSAMRLVSHPLAWRSLSAGQRRRSAFGEAQCIPGSDGGPLHHHGESDLSTNGGRLSDGSHRDRARRHLEIRKCHSPSSHFRTAGVTG